MTRKPTFKEILKDYFDYCIPCLSIFLTTLFIAIMLFTKSYNYILTTHNRDFWYYAVVFLNVLYVVDVAYSFANLVLSPLLISKKKLIKNKSVSEIENV